MHVLLTFACRSSLAEPSRLVLAVQMYAGTLSYYKLHGAANYHFNIRAGGMPGPVQPATAGASSDRSLLQQQSRASNAEVEQRLQRHNPEQPEED
jgi:hypothetical protein